MGPVVDLGLAAVEIEPDHLVLGAHVDAHGPELLRRAGNQIVEIVDRPADQVGDAARRIAGPAPLLEGHDLEVGRAAAGLGGGGHPGRVASDHQQALSHPETVRGERGGAGRLVRGPMTWQHGRMGVRDDCRHYLHRSTPAGEAVQRCRLSANQEDPFACPDGCLFFEDARRVRRGLDPAAQRAHEQHGAGPRRRCPRPEERTGPEAPLARAAER